MSSYDPSWTVDAVDISTARCRLDLARIHRWLSTDTPWARDRRLLLSRHVDSRNGQHLAASPFASMTFYWRETLQQSTGATGSPLLHLGRKTYGLAAPETADLTGAASTRRG